MCIKAEAKILLYLEYEANKSGTSREALKETGALPS